MTKNPSLSKGFGLIDRFSEDIDLAVINTDDKSNNQVKTIIRTIEKEITGNMVEITLDGVTGKGSRFRKSVFEYESVDSKNKSKRLIVELNSFANPFPYQPMAIQSMIHNFLVQTNNVKYVDQYDLQAFSIYCQILIWFHAIYHFPISVVKLFTLTGITPQVTVLILVKLNLVLLIEIAFLMILLMLVKMKISLLVLCRK